LMEFQPLLSIIISHVVEFRPLLSIITVFVFSRNFACAQGGQRDPKDGQREPKRLPKRAKGNPRDKTEFITTSSMKYTQW